MQQADPQRKRRRKRRTKGDRREKWISVVGWRERGVK